MILRPGLSFSESNRRWPEAVKSVVCAGVYSSCTTLAFEPTATSASLSEAMPSLPKALSWASVAMLMFSSFSVAAAASASCEELRAVRKI